MGVAQSREHSIPFFSALFSHVWIRLCYQRQHLHPQQELQAFDGTNFSQITMAPYYRLADPLQSIWV